MSITFPISDATQTPVRLQQHISDRRTAFDHKQYRGGSATRNVTRAPEQLLHPFLPQFVDQEIERRYRDARLEYRLAALKATVTAGVFISMLFAALELLTIHDPSRYPILRPSHRHRDVIGVFRCGLIAETQPLD